MRKTVFLIGIMACLLLIPYAISQELQTGSIRGRVIDENGAPLPGVAITISGPALIGKVTTVTNSEGQFRAPLLTPGTGYQVRAELRGFETIVQTDFIINVNKTISIEIKLKPSTIQQEVTVTAPTPTVDVVKSSTSRIVTSDVLASLPLARDIRTVLQFVPGAVGGSVHGDGRGEIGAVMDGIQMTEPDVGGVGFGYDVGIAWDMVEEAEVVTAGATAQFFGSGSGLTNVVMKSGGNKLSGEASFYYTNQHLSAVHLTDTQVDALNLAKPSVPVYAYDTAFALGGPIIKDRLWVMGEFRYIFSKNTGDFRPTVINGKEYSNYDRPFPNYIGYLKFSAQLTKNLRASLMGHYSMEDVPYYYTGWQLTDEANLHNKPIRFNYGGTLSWTINSSTILDFRAGGMWFKWTGHTTKDGNPDGPAFTDQYTGYQWGQNGGEQYTYKPKVNISLTGTKFLDNFLGGNHELKAGLEWERNRGDWGFYMKQPLFWSYYDGSPYYFAAQNGGVTDPVYGDGALYYAAIGTTASGPGSSDSISLTSRIGGFVQDSFTIKRLTVSLGLRADHLTGWAPASVKGAATDPVALALGATYFEPIYGFNPYAEISYPAWNNAFPYGTQLSPRVGVTYDLLGNGKWALKASFSRQQEGVPTAIVVPPLSWYGFDFSWWDDNHNGVPDVPGPGGDHYAVLYDESPLNMVSTAYLNSVDPKLRMPYTLEYTAGTEYELIKDLNLGVRYIHKDRKNVLASVLWDQDTGQYWYTHDQAPQWWIPFTTTVPAYGNFPARQVTMYFLSNDAPDQYFRLTNVPEGVMKYHSVEVSFDKRLANGWQLGGSVTFSKSTGNYPVSYASWASFYNFASPNSFVNAYGDLPYSRPLVIKLFGSFSLPYNFLFSFFYMHTDGSPWGRTVKVQPPAGWAEDNNVSDTPYTVYVEPPGSRRNESVDDVDFRLEKDFKVGPGKIGLYMDIFNLLGAYTLTVAQNPGGTWRPTDNNTSEGTYTPGSTGLRGFAGSRQVRFSLLYRF
jgi:hypothetical protein